MIDTATRNPLATFQAGDLVPLSALPDVCGRRLPPFPDLIRGTLAETPRAMIGHCPDCVGGDVAAFSGTGTALFCAGALKASAKRARQWAADGIPTDHMASAARRLASAPRIAARAVGVIKGPDAVTRRTGPGGRVRTVREAGAPFVRIEARDGSRCVHIAADWWRWMARNLRDCAGVAILDERGAFGGVAFLGREERQGMPAPMLAYIAPVTMPERRAEGTPRERLDAFRERETERRAEAAASADPLPEGLEKATKAAFLRDVAERGATLAGAPHRRTLADVAAWAVQACAGPCADPCPVTVRGQTLDRTRPDGRVSSATLDKHATAYRVGPFGWLIWSEYPAEPGSPAHTVGLVYHLGEG